MESARSNCSDPQLFFGSLSVLLGFPDNTAIQANTKTESHSKVEINRGHRYAEVICDIVDRSKAIEVV